MFQFQMQITFICCSMQKTLNSNFNTPLWHLIASQFIHLVFDVTPSTFSVTLIIIVKLCSYNYLISLYSVLMWPYYLVIILYMSVWLGLFPEIDYANLESSYKWSGTGWASFLNILCAHWITSETGWVFTLK